MTREDQRQRRRDLTEYMRQAEKPQTVYEITRGFNMRFGWNMSGPWVYTWLRHPLRRDRISRRRVGRRFQYRWRRLEHPLLAKPLDVDQAKELAEALRAFTH